MPWWLLIMRLGEAQILLPAMLACACWLAASARSARLALAWLGLTGLAGAVTASSKIGFIGFGFGFAPLDYTGVSGHALFAAAALPALLRLCLGPFMAQRAWLATALGLCLALLVGYGRVRTGAHSVSEVLLGLVMGSFASLWPMRRFGLPQTAVPARVPVLLLLWLTLLALNAPPSRSHDRITEVALHLSGHATPYTRRDMWRQVWLQQTLKRLRQQRAAPISAAVSVPH